MNINKMKNSIFARLIASFGYIELCFLLLTLLCRDVINNFYLFNLFSIYTMLFPQVAIMLLIPCTIGFYCEKTDTVKPNNTIKNKLLNCFFILGIFLTLVMYTCMLGFILILTGAYNNTLS